MRTGGSDAIDAESERYDDRHLERVLRDVGATDRELDTGGKHDAGRVADADRVPDEYVPRRRR